MILIFFAIHIMDNDHSRMLILMKFRIAISISCILDGYFESRRLMKHRKNDNIHMVATGTIIINRSFVIG